MCRRRVAAMEVESEGEEERLQLLGDRVLLRQGHALVEALWWFVLLALRSGVEEHSENARSESSHSQSIPGRAWVNLQRDSSVTNSRTPQRRACSTVFSYPQPTSAGAWESEENVTGIPAETIRRSSRSSG